MEELVPFGQWGEAGPKARAIWLPSTADAPRLPPWLVPEAEDLEGDSEEDISLSPWQVPGLALDPLTVLFTWVYNRARGAVLVTMVLHAAYNSTLFTLSDPSQLDRYPHSALLGTMAGLFWLVALALIAVDGPDLGAPRAGR